MQFKSILKPEGSVISGIATAGLVAVIFAKTLPSDGIVHATTPNDINVDAARKKATLTSIGILSVITLLTRSPEIFVLGGVTTIALDFNARHANASHPVTGALVSGTDSPPGQLRMVSEGY